MNSGAKACTLLLCVVLSACASRRPADADLRHMVIQAAPAEAEAPTARTKGDVAGTSALGGSGGGLLLGALVCAAIPFAAPGCLALVAPTTVTLGAVSSGVIGSTIAKNTDLAPAELTARLDTAAAELHLVNLLQQRAHGDMVATGLAAPTYALNVKLADLRMTRVDGGKPAPLVLLARVQIQATGSATPVWTKDYRVVGTDKRPASEWAAVPDASPIETLLGQLAERISTDLSPRKI